MIRLPRFNPFDAWDRKGHPYAVMAGTKEQAWFSNVKCAARTAAAHGYTIEGPEGTWDVADCKKIAVDADYARGWM